MAGLVVQADVRDLCRVVYEGHPHGCPNFGKRDCCPPKAPFISETLDLAKPIFVIWNAFDLGSHTRRMKTIHPNWKERQTHCCLYWQGTARKQLRKKIGRFLEVHPKMVIVLIPEAQGVNVTATMEQLGIRLEWPPRRLAYQVAIAGYGKVVRMTRTRGGR